MIRPCLAHVHRLGTLRVAIAVFLAAAVLAIRFFALDFSRAYSIQMRFGYALVMGAFLFCAVPVATGLWRNRLLGVSWLRTHKLAVVLAFAVGAMLHAQEPHVLRVLFDETSHAIGALGMHYYKQAAMPAMSHYVGDVFTLGELYPSFRPHFFPFLVSLLHDLSGYRVENIFILNGVLGVCLLMVTYQSACELGGKVNGLLALVFLALLPLLAQIVTSGSYDLLNTTLVAALIWIGMRLLRGQPNERGVDLVQLGTYVGVLASLTRAESVLYLVPWTLLVAGLVIAGRPVRLSWATAISPLFLLPNLACNYLLLAHASAMDPLLSAGSRTYLSLQYLPSHLAECVYFFFNFDPLGLSCFPVAVIGSLGLLFLIVVGVRTIRSFGPIQIVAGFAISVACVYCVILSQYWSSPLSPEATRFSLSFWWILAVAAGWLVSRNHWIQGRPLVALSIVGLWFVWVSVPTSAQAVTTHSFIISRAHAWLVGQANERPAKDVLYVAESPTELIANRFAAIPLSKLNEHPEVSTRALKAQLYKDVMIFQMQTLDTQTGEWIPFRQNDLVPSIEYEVVEETRLGLGFKGRLLRYMGHKEGEVLIRPESEAPSIALRTNFKSQEEQQRYLLQLYPR